MNKYLEKVALTRLVKEIIKNPGKFNVNNLSKKGLIRPIEKYTEGITRGTESLAKKVNAPISTINFKENGEGWAKMLNHGGHEHTVLLNANGSTTSAIQNIRPGIVNRFFNPIYKLFSSKKNTANMFALGNRHEAHEVTEGVNHWAKTGFSEHLKGNTIPPYNGFVANKKGKLVGNHANLAVLMRESNDVRKIPYRDSLSNLVKYRKSNGESQVLKDITGKSYGESFTRKDYAKGRSATPNFDISENKVFKASK